MGHRSRSIEEEIANLGKRGQRTRGRGLEKKLLSPEVVKRGGGKQKNPPFDTRMMGRGTGLRYLSYTRIQRCIRFSEVICNRKKG